MLLVLCSPEYCPSELNRGMDMKHVERVAAAKASTEPRWRRYVSDSALAIVGVALVTTVIAVAQLYPRIPTISFVYLLVVLALAGTRGLYAASLASLLAVLAFDFFFFPPLDTFVVVKFDDLLTLCVFYEQAQELAALQEQQHLARELHDSVSQALYGISLGDHTAQEGLEREPEQDSPRRVRSSSNCTPSLWKQKDRWQPSPSRWRSCGPATN